jgi:hypothetical protein
LPTGAILPNTFLPAQGQERGVLFPDERRLVVADRSFVESRLKETIVEFSLLKKITRREQDRCSGMSLPCVAGWF